MTETPIPLFDGDCGPTLDGSWLDNRPGLTFSALRETLTAAGFIGGLAQGLPGVCGYEHEAFARAALAQPHIYPVAAWDGSDAESMPSHMVRLKDLGFVGVHVHPRLTGIGPDRPQFQTLLRSAGQVGLPIFYCTYQFADVRLGLPLDHLPDLAAALRQAPSARMVLLHGGTVELLRYAEFTRANPRVLLDLSMTLMRYEGTSLDADLSHVMRTLDRRVCLGTDAPEHAPADVRHRFERLTSSLSREKRLNVAGRSLSDFLNLDLYRAED